MKNRKIFSLAFLHTNDVGTIQGEQGLGEQLPKDKQLMIVRQMGKFTILTPDNK